MTIPLQDFIESSSSITNTSDLLDLYLARGRGRWIPKCDVCTYWGPPQAGRIAELALQLKLPSIYSDPLFATAGGLMSYGPNFDRIIKSLATYIDKIFKGAKPADLPVEQPSKFELIINLKTAKALGLDIPPNLLLLADEVIE